MAKLIEGLKIVLLFNNFSTLSTHNNSKSTNFFGNKGTKISIYNLLYITYINCNDIVNNFKYAGFTAYANALTVHAYKQYIIRI